MKKLHKIKNQRGVFLPLSAVISLGLFTMLFLLIGYSGRVKMAQSELRAKLDITCGDVSLLLSSQQKENIFRAHIQNLQTQGVLRYVDLDEAVLYLPVMPGVTGDIFPENIGNTKFIIKRSVHGAEGYPKNFWNDLKNAGNTTGCEFNGKPRTKFVPPYFLSLLTGSDDTIRLKSVWWTPIRSPSQPVPDINKLPPLDSTYIQKLSGLTIAVGTEMFTTTFDQRFRFKAEPSIDNLNAFVGLSSKKYYEKQTNLKSFLPIGSSTPNISDFSPPNNDVALIGPGARRVGSSERFDETFSFMQWLPSELDNFPGPGMTFDDADFTDKSMPSQRDGLLTSCMNPAILVRNAFLSTIVELAARHGQMRYMTEILHMNPMHRHVDFYPADDSYISNPPARIVEFGQDLMARDYQIPYVFYHTGVNGKEYPIIPATIDNSNLTNEFQWFANLNWNSKTNLAGSKIAFGDGWINPFYRANSTSGWLPNTDQNLARQNQLIAAQLRYCYNLYSSTGLKRFDSFNSNIFDSPRYESDDYGEGWGTQRTRAVDDQHWDQKCDDKPCTTDNEKDNDLLNAPQLVSMLGSTQLCPMSYVRDSSSTLNTFLPNIKVDQNLCPLTMPPTHAGRNWDIGQVNSKSQPLELVPDIIGTLRYIAKYESAPDSTTGKALNPPGIFPINASSKATEPFAISGGDYSANRIYDTPSNTNSHIVLVFHQPVREDKIRDQIKKLVSEIVAGNSSNGLTRYITIFYFPTTYDDHSQIQHLISAFTVAPKWVNPDSEFPDDSIFASSDPRGFTMPITMYNFSPYDPNLGKACGGPGNVTSTDGSIMQGTDTKTQSEIFRDYWHCLLTDSDNNIVLKAREIFSHRLLENELKF